MGENKRWEKPESENGKHGLEEVWRDAAAEQGGGVRQN